MLQYNSMACLFNKRGNFDRGAFTLLELMIIFGLIGIIVALLIPKLVETREEAYRQAARQQVRVLETALANWFTAQPSLQSASTTWTTYSSGGYINDPGGNFMALLAPYIDGGSPGDGIHFGNFIYDQGTGALYTNEMNLIQLPPAPNNTFIYDTSDVNSNPANLTYAHVRLYWDPANRTTVSPKAYFFLPQINSNS